MSLTGRLALTAAVVGTVLGPLHALARYATADGAADDDAGYVAAWADPARSVLGPLLDWSDPDTVYLTYGKLWLPVLLAAVVCAFAVRRTRPATGFELWSWRVALTGYVLATLSVLGDYWTPWLDESFLFLGVPGMLVSLLGSTLLGIALLRRRFVPRATGWLLATWLLSLVALSSLFSLGAALVPMLWAWALAGRRLTPTAVAPALTGTARRS